MSTDTTQLNEVFAQVSLVNDVVKRNITSQTTESNPLANQSATEIKYDDFNGDKKTFDTNLSVQRDACNNYNATTKIPLIMLNDMLTVSSTDFDNVYKTNSAGNYLSKVDDTSVISKLVYDESNGAATYGPATLKEIKNDANLTSLLNRKIRWTDSSRTSFDAYESDLQAEDVEGEDYEYVYDEASPKRDFSNVHASLKNIQRELQSLFDQGIVTDFDITNKNGESTVNYLEIFPLFEYETNNDGSVVPTAVSKTDVGIALKDLLASTGDNLVLTVVMDLVQFAKQSSNLVALSASKIGLDGTNLLSFTSGDNDDENDLTIHVDNILAPLKVTDTFLVEPAADKKPPLVVSSNEVTDANILFARSQNHALSNAVDAELTLTLEGAQHVGKQINETTLSGWTGNLDVKTTDNENPSIPKEKRSTITFERNAANNLPKSVTLDYTSLNGNGQTYELDRIVSAVVTYTYDDVQLNSSNVPTGVTVPKTLEINITNELSKYVQQTPQTNWYENSTPGSLQVNTDVLAEIKRRELETHHADVLTKENVSLQQLELTYVSPVEKNVTVEVDSTDAEKLIQLTGSENNVTTVNVSFTPEEVPLVSTNNKDMYDNNGVKLNRAGNLVSDGSSRYWFNVATGQPVLASNTEGFLLETVEDDGVKYPVDKNNVKVGTTYAAYKPRYPSTGFSKEEKENFLLKSARNGFDRFDQEQYEVYGKAYKSTLYNHNYSESDRDIYFSDAQPNGSNQWIYTDLIDTTNNNSQTYTIKIKSESLSNGAESTNVKGLTLELTKDVSTTEDNTETRNLEFRGSSDIEFKFVPSNSKTVHMRNLATNSQSVSVNSLEYGTNYLADEPSSANTNLYGAFGTNHTVTVSFKDNNFLPFKINNEVVVLDNEVMSFSDLHIKSVYKSIFSSTSGTSINAQQLATLFTQTLYGGLLNNTGTGIEKPATATGVNTFTVVATIFGKQTPVTVNTNGALSSGSALYTHVAAFKNSSGNPIWVSIENVRNAALSNSNVDSVLLGGNDSATVSRFIQNTYFRLATNSSGSGSITVSGIYELEQAGLNTNTFNMTVNLDDAAGGMFLRNTAESINDAYSNRTNDQQYYSSTTDKLLAIFYATAAPFYTYGRHSNRVLIKANGSQVTTQLIGEISVSDIANILDVQVNQSHNIYMPDGSNGWTEITQASQLATAPDVLRIGRSSDEAGSIEISNKYQNGDLYDFKDDVSNIAITGFTSYYKESGSDRWFDRSSDVQVTEVGPTSGTDESSWVFPDPTYKDLYKARLKEKEYQNYPRRQDMIKFEINKVEGSDNVLLGTFVCKNESTSDKCNLVEVAEQLANVMASGSGYPTTEMPGYESTSSDKVEAPLSFTDNVSDDIDQDAIINRLQDFVRESLSDLSNALSDDATSLVTRINDNHIAPSKSNIFSMLSSTASGNDTPSIYKLLKMSNDRVEEVSNEVNHIKRDGIATSNGDSGIIDNANLPTYSNIKASIADIRNNTKTSVIHLESINNIKKEIERRLADVTALIDYHKDKSEADGKERMNTTTSELITIAKGFVGKYDQLNTELLNRNNTINDAVTELAEMADRINVKARLAQYAVQEVATIADIQLSQTLTPYRPESIIDSTLQNQTQAVVNETIS